MGPPGPQMEAKANPSVSKCKTRPQEHPHGPTSGREGRRRRKGRGEELGDGVKNEKSLPQGLETIKQSESGKKFGKR